MSQDNINNCKLNDELKHIFSFVMQRLRRKLNDQKSNGLKQLITAGLNCLYVDSIEQQGMLPTLNVQI